MKLILLTTLVLSKAISHVEFYNKFQVEDFVVDLFDFSGDNVNCGTGGNITRFNIENKPALQGSDASLTALHVSPCSINLPHTHPRATEMLFVSEGSNIITGFVLENGSKTFVTTLQRGQAILYPHGAIHFQINNSCQKAIMIPSFNNNDPGVSTVLNNIFTFSNDILEATSNLSEAQLQFIRNLIPTAPSFSVNECKKRCGLN